MFPYLCLLWANTNSEEGLRKKIINTPKNEIDYLVEILARVETDQKASVAVSTFKVRIVGFNAWDAWSMGIFPIPLRRDSASSKVDLFFSRQRAGWAPGGPGCASGGRAPLPAILCLRRSIANKSALFSRNCYKIHIHKFISGLQNVK